MYPVLFKLGPLTVHAWGVFLMLGFLLATWRAARNAHRYQIPPEDAWDVALWGLLGGVIGARLAYVLLNTEYFSHHLSEVLFIWTGGMTFYGGLAGGILAGAVLCRLRKIPVWRMADLAAVSFPIGYGLGRIGCFLNGCCYGGECDLPWATRFHLPGQPGELTPPSHPAQLYSVIAAILMYVILRKIERQRQTRIPGQIMLAFLTLYGVYRFLIEFVREGATAELSGWLGLTQGQIASLILVIVAAALFAIRRRRAAVSAATAAS